MKIITLEEGEEYGDRWSSFSPASRQRKTTQRKKSTKRAGSAEEDGNAEDWRWEETRQTLTSVWCLGERFSGVTDRVGPSLIKLVWIPLPSKTRFDRLGSHQRQNREVVHETHKADNILLAGDGWQRKRRCKAIIHKDSRHIFPPPNLIRS
ncbi:hypothetical protein PIB30_026964 [Stylosanthes scabra]|uniref:Uncharacterized protein n=1 Tax=Stylosanthes scabra TaxID=79078 RepID=A0ABU6QA25_9FABA|nr:hypothetical protein [Stylosanthes scabra]